MKISLGPVNQLLRAHLPFDRDAAKVGARLESVVPRRSSERQLAAEAAVRTDRSRELATRPNSGRSLSPSQILKRALIQLSGAMMDGFRV